MSAKILIREGANPQIGGGSLGSPFHIAIQKMNIEVIGEILEKIGDVNVRDSDGNTPLHLLFSIFAKNIAASSKIAEMLLERGADPNIKNDECWCPIHIATKRYQHEAIFWAHKYNLKVLGKESSGHKSPLFDFTQTCGSQHWNILHLAGSVGNTLIVDYLIREGVEVDPFAQNLSNQTPKHVSQSNPIITKMLRKYEKIRLNCLLRCNSAPRDTPLCDL